MKNEKIKKNRPLLMMSFIRRLALKSVMAAKKESVAKCGGPLQYGVGRPDGANTMIKTIQYLAEADNSRVLVALDLKAAFQNVFRSAMLYSIAQTDADLAAVFSEWYTGTTEHRMHYDSAYTKISAKSSMDQGCLCQREDFQWPSTLYSAPLWQTSADIRSRCRAFLPTWTTGTCGSNHSGYYRQSLSSQQPPDQSTLLNSPPRYKCGKALARTPFHLSSKTRSHSHSAAWEDIYRSMETLSPALLFWESRPPWRNNTVKAESENVVAESVSAQQVSTEKVVVENAAEEKVTIAKSTVANVAVEGVAVKTNSSAKTITAKQVDLSISSESLRAEEAHMNTAKVQQDVPRDVGPSAIGRRAKTRRVIGWRQLASGSQMRQEDTGLQTAEDSKFFGIASSIESFSNEGKELTIQYQSRCGCPGCACDEMMNL